MQTFQYHKKLLPCTYAMERFLFNSGTVKENQLASKQGMKIKYKENYIEYTIIAPGPEDALLPDLQYSFVE